MRRQLIFDFDLFEPRCGSVKWSEVLIEKFLDALVFANEAYLFCNPSTPSIYDFARANKVRYIREPPDKEIFMTIPAIVRNGGADCEDLAGWRVAELRFRGEAATTHVQKFVPRSGRGPLVYHILVRRGDGSLEDPSKLLGMKGQA